MAALSLAMMMRMEIWTVWTVWLVAVTAQDTSEALVEVAWKTNNERINNLVSSMTAEEKISLLSGTMYSGTQDFAGYINSIPRLGIPAIHMTDGEAGVNGVWNTTAIPSQINVAATFSREMAYFGGEVTGREARALNATIALAPRVNILRDSFVGSFSQGYSEDPYLNGQLGAQAVRGIQDQGTMANTKQIGPSSGGASGGDDNSEVDLQVLHEVYWAPHETLIVDGGAATIMCSYVEVNGVQSCQYDESLNKTLRGNWNFTGVVMSDWGATYSTAASMIAGLDWEMGSVDYYTEPLYEQVYVYKNLSESYINRAVHRILSTYDRFGLLDGHGPQGNSTAEQLTAQPLSTEVAQRSQELAYEIAVRSGALLKNDDGVLPLLSHQDDVETLAVLGATGLQLTNGAGFGERSFGFPDRKVAPVTAIEQAAAKVGWSVNISSSIGVDMAGTVVPASNLQTLDGQAGLVRTAEGEEDGIDTVLDFEGDQALPANVSYGWTGQLLANSTGYYRLSLQRRFVDFGEFQAINASTWLTVFDHDGFTINGTDFEGFRIYGDGGTHPWSSPLATPGDVDDTSDNSPWDNTPADVYLEAGVHNLTVSVTALFADPVEVRLCWVTPEQRAAHLDAAAALAAEVDVPIVFAHANSPPAVNMQLIEGFDDLVSRVATVNPRTVVVLNNADPVLMPWLDDVAAVLWMGNPGQEGGAAVADLLLGTRNPQGHLPVTYPTSVETSMTRNPDDGLGIRVDGANGTAVFSEGLDVGYRWYLSTNTTVLFPFGYGLSYTSFDYRDLTLVPTASDSSSFTVQFTLRNTGDVAGAAVPQLYLGPPSTADSAYPNFQFATAALVGFDTIDLTVGAARRVSLPISTRQLSFWNQTAHDWVLAHGQRNVWVKVDAETTVLQGVIDV